MEKITTMANVLVELALDPTILTEFKENPTEFLKDRNLTREESEALIAGNGGLIRYYAKGISGHIFGDDVEKMSGIVAHLAAIVVNSDVVEIVGVAAPDGSSESTSNSIFVDKSGNYFTWESTQKIVK